MVKKILSRVREYKIFAILSPMFVLVEAFMDILIPYLMSIIIDKGIANSSQDIILKVGTLLVLAVLTTLTFGVFSGISCTKAAAGLAKNLRYDMYKNIQSLSFEDIESFTTGSLVTRMTSDVENIQFAFRLSIRLAVRSPLMLAFAVIMSFKINSSMAINFLLVFPALILGLYLIIKNAYPIFDFIFKTTDKLNTIVSENLLGIRVVKSFDKEEHESDKFNKISDKIYKKSLKVFKLMANMTPLMQIITYILILIVAWVGAHLIVVDQLKTGELLSLITYAIQIQISLMMMSFVIIQITIAKNSAVRISEVLDKNPSIKNPVNPIYEVSNGDIEFENVNFSYVKDEEKLALKNVNLKIKSGDSVGIIGPTGSSKSTLVNLIPRLYDVLSGTVKVGGVDVREYDLKTLRDSVSMVLQKNQLFTGTVLENLRWGNENASLEEVIEVCKISSAHDFIMEYANGYDRSVERGGTNFSGGQKQRLCIARALLKNPKILILDDSTSALDNETELKITKSLNELRPDLTKIKISQKINSIKDCDYIIVMCDGQIDDIGTNEELYARNEIYREIADTQNQGGDFDEQK